jgi:putative addiction module CopG family antidote
MITNLPKQTEEDIQRLIDTGEYSDSTDVVVQGVRLLSKRREKTEHLRALLQEGLDASDRGEVFEFTPDLMRQIREESRKLVHSGTPLDPDVCG